MKIPNNIDSAEMTTLIRAKANHKKFTKQEREWLRDVSRMIEYLVKKVTEYEAIINDKNKL